MRCRPTTDVTDVGLLLTSLIYSCHEFSTRTFWRQREKQAENLRARTNKIWQKKHV